MSLDRFRLNVRSLRTRLMLWNVGAVAVTGLLILLAVRAGVRYTLLYDLDQALREDLREIDLHFQRGLSYNWSEVTEELNRKAEGHDFHRWFVQFYGADGQPTWSSIQTPHLPPLTAQQKQHKSFTLDDYRLSYDRLSHPIPEGSDVCVGCSQRYLARDMATIDRLVFSVGLIVLLISPLVGHLLTNRTIQPLAQMIRTTARLRPGEFGQRMPIRGTGDELDSLARTINGLLDRIATYLQQEHDFLANAAHDLRTPLAAIRSSVEVALSGQRNEEEYRELLGLVIDQCSALQTLVNQLLLLAETDADRLQTDAEPVALDQVVARAAEMFEGVAEFHGIELRLAELPSVSVAGNRHHLRQVVSNLLDNAIKFTAARGEFGRDLARGVQDKPHVEVDLVRDDQRQQVRLRVSDNGIGIDREHLPYVFDRFYRADKSRSRDGVASGTGLGLSICKAIVEAHRGTISVKSRPGEGAAFTVTLPLVGQSSNLPPLRGEMSAQRAPAT